MFDFSKFIRKIYNEKEKLSEIDKKHIDKLENDVSYNKILRYEAILKIMRYAMILLNLFFIAMILYSMSFIVIALYSLIISIVLYWIALLIIHFLEYKCGRDKVSNKAIYMYIMLIIVLFVSISDISIIGNITALSYKTKFLCKCIADLCLIIGVVWYIITNIKSDRKS